MATGALRAADPALRPYNLMFPHRARESARGPNGRNGGPIAGGRGQVSKGPPAGGPGGSAAKQKSRGAERTRGPFAPICRQGRMQPMKKGPGAPRAHMEKEKERGRRGGIPPRRPRARARLDAGRAPSTGQRRPALPRADPAVPSALGGLASGFGMGPGVPRPPWPLTGGRRSSSDDENASHARGVPRALGAAQRA